MWEARGRKEGKGHTEKSGTTMFKDFTWTSWSIRVSIMSCMWKIYISGCFLYSTSFFFLFPPLPKVCFPFLGLVFV
jgi:hypothetical protein